MLAADIAPAVELGGVLRPAETKSTRPLCLRISSRLRSASACCAASLRQVRAA